MSGFVVFDSQGAADVQAAASAQPLEQPREQPRAQPPQQVGGHGGGVAVVRSQRREFLMLQAAFRASGGLTRGDDLAHLLHDRQCGDFVSLARLIATRQIFVVEWKGGLWVPMFQFDVATMSVKPAARDVVREFGTAFDGWSLAAWFIEHNAWLGDKRPLDLLDSDLPSVIGAARADRFLVNM